MPQGQRRHCGPQVTMLRCVGLLLSCVTFPWHQIGSFITRHHSNKNNMGACPVGRAVLWKPWFPSTWKSLVYFYAHSSQLAWWAKSRLKKKEWVYLTNGSHFVSFEDWDIRCSNTACRLLCTWQAKRKRRRRDMGERQASKVLAPQIHFAQGSGPWSYKLWVQWWPSWLESTKTHTAVTREVMNETLTGKFHGK